MLSGNNARLFIISALSFILRWGYAFFDVSGLITLLRSDFFARLTEAYDKRLIYALTAIIYSILFTLMLITVSAIKTGERFIYFIRAEGFKGRFLLLFKFLGIKKGFKTLCLCLAVNGLKLLWLIYFLVPAALCSLCTLYLYKFGNISTNVIYILLTGATLLFAISMVMWRSAVLRYDAASYYMCLRNMSVRDAIKKSIHYTDGVLSEGVVLEYSLLGWLLSCILIVPIFYCVPYIKLCKAVFTTEAVSRKATKKMSYAISYISSKHINQSS